MKLHSASRKELSRIALGILICDGFLMSGLFLLSRFGIGSFELFRILPATAGGSIIALLNFSILCLTVQCAADTENEKKRKTILQLSYNIRLFLQAAWIVICFALRPIPFPAGTAPILFPYGVVFYLQSKPASSKTATGGDDV